MNPGTINAAGLLLDITGAVLIFFNSPAFSYIGYDYGVDEAQELERKARRKRRLAQTGIALMALGFTAQLLATLLKNN